MEENVLIMVTSMVRKPRYAVRADTVVNKGFSLEIKVYFSEIRVFSLSRAGALALYIAASVVSGSLLVCSDHSLVGVLDDFQL